MKTYLSPQSIMPLAFAATLLVAPQLHAQTVQCVGDIVTCGAQGAQQPSGSYGQTGYPTQTTQPQSSYGSSGGYGNSNYGNGSSGSTGYGAGSSNSGYGSAGYGSSGYGSSSYGNTSSYGSNSLGTSGSSAVQGAPASALGQRGGAYGSSGGYGANGASGYGQASPYGAQPQIGNGPASSNGPCTAKISEDRNAITLVDATAGADRSVVALGQDRVQQLFKSPDGAWAVAVFKVRGQAQYGALLFDLAGCAQSGTADLANAADAAQFSATDVALTLKGGTSQSLPLKPSEH